MMQCHKSKFAAEKAAGKVAEYGSSPCAACRLEEGVGKITVPYGDGKAVDKAAAGKDGLHWPCWRVRVCVKGCGALYFLCKTEPRVKYENGAVLDVELDAVTGTALGDTPGFIDWREVGAVSWRLLAFPETGGAGVARPSARTAAPAVVTLLSLVDTHPGLTEQDYRDRWSSVFGKNGFWPVRKGLHEAVGIGWLSSRGEDGANRYFVTDTGRKALAESEADGVRPPESGPSASGARQED